MLDENNDDRDVIMLEEVDWDGRLELGRRVVFSKDTSELGMIKLEELVWDGGLVV